MRVVAVAFSNFVAFARCWGLRAWRAWEVGWHGLCRVGVTDLRPCVRRWFCVPVAFCPSLAPSLLFTSNGTMQLPPTSRCVWHRAAIDRKPVAPSLLATS